MEKRAKIQTVPKWLIRRMKPGAVPPGPLEVTELPAMEGTGGC